MRDTIRTMIFQNQDTAALYFFLAKTITICNATWQLHIALFGRAGSLGMTSHETELRLSDNHLSAGARTVLDPSNSETQKHEQRSASRKRYNCRSGRAGQDRRR